MSEELVADQTTLVPMREFSHSLPMALMRAREAVMGNFRPTLSEHDLTEQQFRVLRALTAQMGPIDFGLLAEMTLLLGPSLSRILNNLEHRGMIMRTTVEHDARRSQIIIARPGTELVQEIAPRSEEQYSAIEVEMGAAPMAELTRLLGELTRAARDRDRTVSPM